MSEFKLLPVEPTPLVAAAPQAEPMAAADERDIDASVVELARLFHDTYERLAPAYGYETRPDTKQFDPHSPNGRLMCAVIRRLRATLASPPALKVEQEPFGYVVKNKADVQIFYKSTPYLDNAVECVTVYRQPLQSAIGAEQQ